MEKEKGKEEVSNIPARDHTDFLSTTFSETSSESGEDAVTQKIHSWKILLTQLQKELQAERAKTRGHSAIVTAFKDLKAETLSLKEAKKQYCDAVSVLQNRLATLGADTSVKLGDGEILLPGPSKQVLDSLAEENIQLKRSLKYVAVDPERVERLQRQSRTLEMELAECQKRVKHFEAENNRITGLLTSSDSKKDIEILKLQKQILDLTSKKDTQNILCQSLSDETDDLRGKLRETVRQCQQLEQNLINSSGRVYLSTDSANRRLNSAQNVSLETEKFGALGSGRFSPRVVDQQSQQQTVESLQALVTKREAEIKEVSEMNMKWQSYNDQREEHIRKLQKSLGEVEGKLAKCESELREGGITEEQQAAIDQIILQHKRKVEVAEEEKQEIEEENRLLKTQLRACETELQTKQQEVTVLQGHIQILQSGQGSGHLSDKDKISLLEQQIAICKEDFECERKDRLGAVEKANKLETEVQFLRRQLEQFQGHKMEALAMRRQDSLNRYERQFSGQPYMAQDMVGRGRDYERFCTDGEDTVDSPEVDGVSQSGNQPSRFVPQASLGLANTAEKSKVPDTGLRRPSGKEEDMLECPNCQLKFPASRHFELLDHINECC